MSLLIKHISLQVPPLPPGLPLADARLDVLYNSGSDDGGNLSVQEQRSHDSHENTESLHTEEGAPLNDGVATTPSSTDVDGERGSSGETDDEDQDDEDQIQLSDNFSSSTSGGEESDENWESLEYIR